MAIERIVPGTIEWEAFYSNHIFRYRFALDLLLKHDKKNILDAACGVGYGSHFLATNEIQNIVAVDRDNVALNIAKDLYTHDKITFLRDDCHTLKNAAKHGKFSAIVSFETLEHLPNPEAFLKQCYFLLEEGGMLILSTPNALVTSPDGKINWEFHEKEYTKEQLNSILVESAFTNIEIYGQSYSAIGKLRQNVRTELNKIYSNPFNRAGRWIQHILKGHKVGAVLPEKIEDFEITASKDFKFNLPFVLIAVVFK